MNERNFIITVTIIFILVGLLHLLRSIFSWTMVIQNFIVPLWVSYLAVIILVFMIYSAFKLLKK
ncbi:MAG: hypothetical protein ACE5ES_01955 [Candidatus Nanoarchaeia archaeon]